MSSYDSHNTYNTAPLPLDKVEDEKGGTEERVPKDAKGDRVPPIDHEKNDKKNEVEDDGYDNLLLSPPPPTAPRGERPNRHRLCPRLSCCPCLLHLLLAYPLPFPSICRLSVLSPFPPLPFIFIFPLPFPSYLSNLLPFHPSPLSCAHCH